jgi:hypothetical protein
MENIENSNNSGINNKSNEEQNKLEESIGNIIKELPANLWSQKNLEQVTYSKEGSHVFIQYGEDDLFQKFPGNRGGKKNSLLDRFSGNPIEKGDAILSYIKQALREKYGISIEFQTPTIENGGLSHYQMEEEPYWGKQKWFIEKV